MKLQWGRVNWYTLSFSLVALVNSALVSLGTYHLNSNQLTHVDEGVSLVISLFGIIFPHGMTQTIQAEANASPLAPHPPDTGTATGVKQ